jgi:hypothetical protein
VSTLVGDTVGIGFSIIDQPTLIDPFDPVTATVSFVDTSLISNEGIILSSKDAFFGFVFI